jgi:hypothetical protein
MSPKVQWVQSACIVLALGCTHAVADSSRLAEHRVMIPERGEVLGYIISVETNHYSFLPPPGWRVSCKPGAKAVVMIAVDLTTSITVDFLEADTTKTVQKRAAELLSSRYPEGRLRQTFAFFTGLGEGTAFDIERQVGDAPKLASRVIYAIQDAGVVEFTLTTPRAKFGDWTTTFANVVNSFQRPVR